MNIEILEEDLVHSQSSHNLDPLYQLDADVLSLEIETFAADGELPLLLLRTERVVDHRQVVGDRLALLLHQRDRVRDAVTVSL